MPFFHSFASKTAACYGNHSTFIHFSYSYLIEFSQQIYYLGFVEHFKSFLQCHFLLFINFGSKRANLIYKSSNSIHFLSSVRLNSRQPTVFLGIVKSFIHFISPFSALETSGKITIKLSDLELQDSSAGYNGLGALIIMVDPEKRATDSEQSNNAIALLVNFTSVFSFDGWYQNFTFGTYFTMVEKSSAPFSLGGDNLKR